MKYSLTQYFQATYRYTRYIMYLCFMIYLNTESFSLDVKTADGHF